MTADLATAIIAGHAHCYERSGLEGGVTLITTAGADAGIMNAKDDAKKQNLHSKYSSSLSILSSFVKGTACEIKAIDLDRNVMDKRIWLARSKKAR